VLYGPRDRIGGRARLLPPMRRPAARVGAVCGRPRGPPWSLGPL
jgi:hypothetical protein